MDLIPIKTKPEKKSSKKMFNLDKFVEDMNWTGTNKETTTMDLIKDIDDMVKEMKAPDNLLEKSVIKPHFETLKRVKQYDPSDKKLRERRRRAREKTKGKKWFGLPATEMTDEIKHDLEVIQMRSVLDPKRFYKKNDLKVLPKYFQIGKVMDAPQDFYSSRMTNKERKRTLVDELMADAEFAKYNKRKYQEIIEKKQKTDYKAQRRANKLKKKNRAKDNQN